MKLFKSIAVLAVAALAVASFAQAGGGQGRGQGPGQWMRRGAAMMGGWGLLNRADVQEDLKLTNEQKDKLDEIRREQREKMRAQFEQMRAQGGGGQGQGQGRGGGMMMRMGGQADPEMNKKFEAALTAEQNVRFREIRIQFEGNRVLFDPAFQKELGLTDAQKQKVADLGRTAGEAAAALMQSARNQEISMEELPTRIERNMKVLDTELGKVLSQAQRDKMKAMTGKPFVRKDDN